MPISLLDERDKQELQQQIDAIANGGGGGGVTQEYVDEAIRSAILDSWEAEV